MARALVKASKLRATGARPVILLDEVTAALDVDTESIINDLIEQEFTAKGHTVIMVAHRVGVASGRTKLGHDLVLWITDGSLKKVVSDKTLVELQSFDETKG
ncbi:hypothetical protein F4818DRAFT_444488 [Hypoxylon cercidicola]|nr:hypothetical protein F4818DRAFT_444488 [Hypoxylon cercidicola]